MKLCVRVLALGLGHLRWACQVPATLGYRTSIALLAHPGSICARAARTALRNGGGLLEVTFPIASLPD